ncbi:hypothetical protein GGR56DRAFT_619781 [Xylariaceae sp. FL0804]|nr:hypothetical protein GGR56DRAFT_619781 [Xylariaceae sp. FL0804]
MAERHRVRKSRIEIPLLSKPPPYRPGDGPALAPLSIALKNDTSAFIVDKIVWPTTPAIDKLQMYYVVGWPDLPAARVRILATKIYDYVSPRTLEEWEYNRSLEEDQERESKETERRHKLESTRQTQLSSSLPPTSALPTSALPTPMSGTPSLSGKKRGRPSKADRLARQAAQQTSFRDAEEANVQLSPTAVSVPSLSTPQKKLGAAVGILWDEDELDEVDPNEDDPDQADPDEAISKQLRGFGGYAAVKDQEEDGQGEQIEDFKGLLRRGLSSIPYAHPNPGLSHNHFQEDHDTWTRPVLTTPVPAPFVPRPLPRTIIPPKDVATPVPTPSIPQQPPKTSVPPKDVATPVPTPSIPQQPPRTSVPPKAFATPIPTPSIPAHAIRTVIPRKDPRTPIQQSVRHPKRKAASEPREQTITQATTQATPPIPKVSTPAEPSSGFTPAGRSAVKWSMLNKHFNSGSQTQEAKRPKTSEPSEKKSRRKRPAPEPEPDAEEDGVWEVKRLEGHRTEEVDGQPVRYFRVRWAGSWPPDQNPTWEPESNIPPQLVRQYLKKADAKAQAQGQGNGARAPPGKPRPPVLSTFKRKYSSVAEAFEGDVFNDGAGDEGVAAAAAPTTAGSRGRGQRDGAGDGEEGEGEEEQEMEQEQLMVTEEERGGDGGGGGSGGANNHAAPAAAGGGLNFDLAAVRELAAAFYLRRQNTAAEQSAGQQGL